LRNIDKVPIALFAGKYDDLATVEDARWAREQIKSKYLIYKEIDQFDHSSFLLGKNMSYL